MIERWHVRADSFATKLRLHRLGRCLTQEELAHASGLSVRAVRNFEIGAVRYPRRDSVRRLADALELPEETRRQFFDLSRVERAVSVPVPVSEDAARSANIVYLEPDAPITLTLTAAGDPGADIVVITAARTDVRGEPVVTLTLRAGETTYPASR